MQTGLDLVDLQAIMPQHLQFCDLNATHSDMVIQRHVL